MVSLVGDQNRFSRSNKCAFGVRRNDMVPCWWRLSKDCHAFANLQVDILHHPSTDEGALDVFVKVFTGEPGK